MKKIVGISMNILKDGSGVFCDLARSYVNETYINAVTNAGAIPFLMPITEDDASIKYYTDTIDALILSGGHDVDPHLYGEEMSQKIGNIFPKRDKFDFALIEKMVAKNKPIFGICRGFQILNVYFKGTLFQDLSQIPNALKHVQNQDPFLSIHKVKIEKNNFFFELFGEEVFVNTHHHQALKNVASNFQICAKSSDDLIEAIEDKTRKIIGTQWHPEMMIDKSGQEIFNKFVKEL